MDFYSFSYYVSNCVGCCKDAVSGNLMGGLKNPYLETSDWGWQIDPMEDSQTVLLIDRWSNQESLDIHHASPMMKKIMKLREKYDLHMKVERYVSDDTVVESDKKFKKGCIYVKTTIY